MVRGGRLALLSHPAERRRPTGRPDAGGAGAVAGRAAGNLDAQGAAAGPHQRSRCGAIGGRLLAPGGSKQSRSMTRLDEYDPASDRWRARAPLPQPLDHLGVAVVNGKLYTAGGFDSTVHRNAADAFLEYDPAMDSWRPLAPLKAPLGALGVAVLDGQIHVIGGRKRDHELVDTHQVYDPANGRCRDAAPLPLARDHLAGLPAGAKL